MKINPIVLVTLLVVGVSVVCFVSDKLADKKEKVEEPTQKPLKHFDFKTTKSVEELNKIEYDDFDKQFMDIPVDLKRQLASYEALNYYNTSPINLDLNECTQKHLDDVEKCKNTTLQPSFQTTPDVPDGVFMEGQKPVCHIDRVRAIEDFSCPVKHQKKIEDPCKHMCRHCVVGVCQSGICH